MDHHHKMLTSILMILISLHFVPKIDLSRQTPQETDRYNGEMVWKCFGRKQGSHPVCPHSTPSDLIQDWRQIALHVIGSKSIQGHNNEWWLVKSEKKTYIQKTFIQ